MVATSEFPPHGVVGREHTRDLEKYGIRRMNKPPPFEWVGVHLDCIEFPQSEDVGAVVVVP